MITILRRQFSRYLPFTALSPNAFRHAPCAPPRSPRGTLLVFVPSAANADEEDYLAVLDGYSRRNEREIGVGVLHLPCAALG